MLTEDEAKTKRCCGPVGTGQITGPAPYVSLGDGMYSGDEIAAIAGARAMNAPRNCIGSACMAWRWEREQHRIDLPDRMPENAVRWRYVDPLDPLKVAETNTTHGYCGLASKP